MEFSRHTIFTILLFSTLCVIAQQSYNPFQYGQSPKPNQSPSAPSLQQMQLQQHNYQQIINMGGIPSPIQEQIKANWQNELQDKAPLLDMDLACRMIEVK